jgi:DNA polymerase III delta prime subunit
MIWASLAIAGVATRDADRSPQIGEKQMGGISFPVPREISETGLRKGVLEDLAIKILYLHGELSIVELGDLACLSAEVMDEIFQFLRKEQLCEVRGMSGGSHRVTATGRGRDRAAELLSINQYAGPAPVALADYVARVETQSVAHTIVRPADLDRAFRQLVLQPEIIDRLGAAVASGSSIFLHGPTGTGKTTIASCIPSIYNDSVWIPYALEVDSQIIALHDPGVHIPSSDPSPEEFDRRWILCRRPCVVAGGELSAEMLDLQYNAVSRFFMAPLQMKANNGVLILDDVGRQRMPTEQLLNRWMTPLDRRVDYLSLQSGRKFAMPFDLFVVFSTNLNPLEITDAAFLRRIPNKIEIAHASRRQFIQIFEDECLRRGLTYEPDIPEFVAQYITQEMNQPLCQCYPRDLLNQIFWTANYQGETATLNRETLKGACRNYFLSAKISEDDRAPTVKSSSSNSKF